MRFGLGFKGGNSLSVEQSQFNGQETGATALAAATDDYTHHGQNEAAIIVGVFSNQVDSTGSVHSDGRALVAESPAKLFHRLLAQPLVLGSLRGRLWDRHNSPSLSPSGSSQCLRPSKIRLARVKICTYMLES